MEDPGKLFVIGTPIGNLKDITFRALEALDSVELLVCEDTRVASKLINSYYDLGLLHHKPKYFPYNDYNENSVWRKVISELQRGVTVGLVSDAGMPTISDPGYRLLRACYEMNIPVVHVPGVSSVTTAVATAALGGEGFMFLGFLPKKTGKREKFIISLKETLEHLPDVRIVLFLSPHRIVDELSELASILGEDVQAVLCREMTKKFEERLEMQLGEMVSSLKNTRNRGESVIVLRSPVK